MFTQEPAEYRNMSLSSLVARTGIAPNGIWFTTYEQTPEQRAENVSLAWGKGRHLDVVRPLKAGGAHLYHYDDFTLTSVDTLTEDQYKVEKEKMKQALTAHSPERLLGK